MKSKLKDGDILVLFENKLPESFERSCVLYNDGSGKLRANSYILDMHFQHYPEDFYKDGNLNK